MNNKTLRQALEKQVFTISQAVVVSGKHTNNYELAREALEITIFVKDEVEQFVVKLLSEQKEEWVLGEPKPDDKALLCSWLGLTEQ